MKKINPYSPDQTGAAMEACYASCQTCKYSSDRRMQLCCMHPKRDSAKVCTVSNRSEGHDRPMRKLQQSSNYVVSTDEWCNKYESVELETPSKTKTSRTADVEAAYDA